MTDLNIDPLSVKYILLTHSDSDHLASLDLFPSAQIYMSEDELQMINGTTKRSRNSSNTLPDGTIKDSIVLLTNGEELLIDGHKIVSIKSAGHTPGSMSYLFDDNYLFTGDAFAIKNNSFTVHPFSMDAQTSEASIQNLKSIGKSAKIVLTAHYGWYEPDDLNLD